MRTLQFLFDYLSPYAYLAWTQVHAVAARNEAVVEPVPVLFAALLNARGTKGPAEIPGKREYVFKDAYRNAHRLGVPIAMPATHPFNPLLALRASALPLERAQRRALVDALYRATWAERRRVDQPEVIADIGRSLAIDGLVDAANADDNKARLRANTDAAIAAGAWGVPTIVVDGELFWGLDSLIHVENFLRGEDPIPKDASARWGDLQASASRRP